jgi:hypothetical protein
VCDLLHDALDILAWLSRGVTHGAQTLAQPLLPPTSFPLHRRLNGPTEPRVTREEGGGAVASLFFGWSRWV